MLNESFEFSCNNNFYWKEWKTNLSEKHAATSIIFHKQLVTEYCFCFYFSVADDDSDVNPHDFEGSGSDHEYGGFSTHLNIGQHSFSQMQVCALTFESIIMIANVHF